MRGSPAIRISSFLRPHSFRLVLGSAIDDGQVFHRVMRCEQRLAGDDVDVDAGFLVGPVLAAEWTLGPVLLGDVVLARGSTRRPRPGSCCIRVTRMLLS
jgi:hypothetical protein